MIASEDEARDWLRDHLPDCDAAAMARLECLVDLLVEENRRQNLVSQASLDEVWRRHILDSAQLLRFVRGETSPWLDLGTGAGFPGLVIAALRPSSTVLMVEARARRAEWLDRARIALGLGFAQVIHGRLELVKPQKVSVISARAFAPLPRLLALSARFSTETTLWLLPKGRSAQQELDELCDRTHLFHVEQSVTDPNSGIIVGTLTDRKGARK